MVLTRISCDAHKHAAEMSFLDVCPWFSNTRLSFPISRVGFQFSIKALKALSNDFKNRPSVWKSGHILKQLLGRAFASNEAWRIFEAGTKWTTYTGIWWKLWTLNRALMQSIFINSINCSFTQNVFRYICCISLKSSYFYMGNYFNQLRCNRQVP